MNKNYMKVTAFLLAISLLGCAGVSKKDEQVDVVVTSQVDVLKKIVNLRNQESFKARLSLDPVLQEQENILMAGLESVINSQEIYLRAKNKPECRRSVNER